jgi:hypothetical protein
MKKIFCVFLSLVLIAIAYGKETDEKAFKGEPIKFTVKHPETEDSIPLKAQIPEGWKVNSDFGTVVYQPANALDFYEPPQIEYQALCEGECKAEAIPENIEGYIQRLKDGWKRLATGNEELDKLGANVDILKEEKAEGRVIFEVKLTYPDGVSSAMYPPRYQLYHFIYNDQDPFFILTKGLIPVNLADEFLSQVESSCLTTVKQ